jgi:hypothetical protein
MNYDHLAALFIRKSGKKRKLSISKYHIVLNISTGKQTVLDIKKALETPFGSQQKSNENTYFFLIFPFLLRREPKVRLRLRGRFFFPFCNYPYQLLSIYKVVQFFKNRFVIWGRAVCGILFDAK